MLEVYAAGSFAGIRHYNAFPLPVLSKVLLLEFLLSFPGSMTVIRYVTVHFKGCGFALSLLKY